MPPSIQLTILAEVPLGAHLWQRDPVPPKYSEKTCRYYELLTNWFTDSIAVGRSVASPSETTCHWRCHTNSNDARSRARIRGQEALVAERHLTVAVGFNPRMR